MRLPAAQPIGRPPLAAALAVLILALLTWSAPPASGAASGTPAWFWPVASPKAVVNPFRAPATRYSPGHRGVDLAAAEGSLVYAPADGVVYFAGIVVDRPVLSIRHPDGLLTSFEPVASELSAGAVVHRGDPVGRVRSGHCPSPCVHFGVRRYGEYVSPLNYLGGIPHSVLLPVRPLGGPADSFPAGVR